jgi:catechol 2,3-dioxygenase-like lactoylglutathione lyase family enzyme
MLKGFNHVGYRCRDAATTVDFYTRILGLTWKGLSWAEAVPSIGIDRPHAHLIFGLEDGTTIDFFEVLDANPRTVPADHDFAQHLALAAENDPEAEAIADRVRAAGIEVKGPVDHPLGRSWYFYDPSGHRLEIAVNTTPETTRPVWDYLGREAEGELGKWEAFKAEPAS